MGGGFCSLQELFIELIVGCNLFQILKAFLKPRKRTRSSTLGHSGTRRKRRRFRGTIADLVTW